MARRSTAFEFVQTLLAGLRAEPPENMGASTRVFEDLGVYGDDWDEVLLGLNQFNPVDWSGFEFGRYFPSEPTVLTPIARLFSSRADDRCALTVGHLALVLERGKWFEPPTSP